MTKKNSKTTKTTSPRSMEELLALLPDTGITHGKASNEAAEFVAAHPETWIPVVQSKRGRPRRGEETGSRPKSIRFPDEAWALIEAKARRMNLPLHAAMRKALLDWAQAPLEATPVPNVTTSPSPATSPTQTLVQTQMASEGTPSPTETLLTSFSSESGTKTYGAFIDFTQVSTPLIRRHK